MSASIAGKIPETLADVWRCLSCGGDAEGDGAGGPIACRSCGASYPVRDGIVVARDEASDNNEVARAFYDGPLWPKFRFWEWFTFVNLGGERRARSKVLRHLPEGDDLALLDVAIGDGVYLPWLPARWSVVGVDVSEVQLRACRGRSGDRALSLVLGQAEELPVRDGRFDAALSIGAFNYFNDPERALREMARAVRPGGTIVVSDEVPDLTDYLPFRRMGMPGVERWVVSRMMNLGDDFAAMVERHRKLDVEGIARGVLPGCRFERIWRGMGYVFSGRVPG
ncbi:class I SAM-dependent methyltransferase [Tautonia plasticadhaerens]|uniref:Demethylrebeccamycin-D-glucose O-methyltransferase n=1 Tax=Tautonia plasticadhaerens TaxID=2527974 RepID=A0A518H0K2_9BACT|nr:class I SAM-dependent methyltransferase [Tautonia plasticadhaerens]QDV34363.1 Demethylrebeccamycin-D-glucose O-methyltransferase [Tautonia plasticadhaerens]